jgi:hypothetical protein
MSRTLFVLVLLVLSTGCDSAASVTPVPATAALNTATPALILTPPLVLGTSTPSVATATPVRGTPRPTGTATTAPAGMASKVDGQSLILSNSVFYWSIAIPRDWLISGNNGFEFDANPPGKLAFVHLLAQTWLSKDRKPNAAAYVDYWKQSKYMSVFPFFAEGTLKAQDEISADKFGGPYLRYEFVNGKQGLTYVQVYASGGGPSSIVATVWAKSVDYPGLKSTIDAIINSVALLNEP